MADDKPIIIVKKAGGHGGHHGGAWKVAYADFVTAMMAFFMVMWLINTAEVTTKQNIASYFRKPGLFASGSGTPLMIGEAGILQDAYTPPRPPPKGDNSGELGKQGVKLPPGVTEEKKPGGGPGSEREKKGKEKGDENNSALVKGQVEREGFNIKNPHKEAKTAADLQKEAMQKLAEEIRQQIASSQELQKLLGLVDVKVDADGLNIEIMDTDKASMFASGSARILPEAQAAFARLAVIFGKLPYKIDIVGHTDSKPFSSRNGGYSNWELSADRANAARRLLEASGILPERITSVVGRADTDPKNTTDPLSPSNRRITLKLRVFKAKTTEAEGNRPLTEQEQLNQLFPRTTSDGAAAQPTGTASPSEPTLNPQGTPIAKTKEQMSDDRKYELTHQYTPKQIVKAKEGDDGRILLPEESPPDATTPPGQPGATPGASTTAPPQASPSQSPGGRLFGDSPVIGPPDPFSNL